MKPSHVASGSNDDIGARQYYEITARWPISISIALLSRKWLASSTSGVAGRSPFVCDAYAYARAAHQLISPARISFHFAVARTRLASLGYARATRLHPAGQATLKHTNSCNFINIASGRTAGGSCVGDLVPPSTQRSEHFVRARSLRPLYGNRQASGKSQRRAAGRRGRGLLLAPKFYFRLTDTGGHSGLWPPAKPRLLCSSF